MTRRSMAAACLAAALVTGGTTACGGGSDPAPAQAAAGGGAVPAASAAPSPGASPVARDVGRSVYYAGFKLSVDAMSVAPAADPDPARVTLDVVYANQGTQPSALDPTTTAMDLASGDHHYQPSQDDEAPVVPGQAQSHSTITFEVDSDFTPDTAVLTVGDADHVQSVLPLGTTGSLVDNQAQELTLAQLHPSGKATAAELTVRITEGEIRSDLPKIFRQADHGTRQLLLSFDASNTSSEPTPYGDLVTGDDEFTLKQPNGDSVTAYNVNDAYGGSSVLTVQPGKTGHAFVVFTIQAPTTGSYELTVTNHLDDGSSAAATSTFTLP